MLAECFLDTCWTSTEHQQLIKAFCIRGSAADQELVKELHRQIPFYPSRTRLILFLRSCPLLLKGIQWKRFDALRQRRKLLPSEMHPTRPLMETWSLPIVPSVSTLAVDILGVSPRVVDWFCNHRIDHYVMRAIPKRGDNRTDDPFSCNSYRILEQPKYYLKAAQREILFVLLNKIPPHPCAHGFVANRNVLTFARPHAGQETILRMDLQDFFPSIQLPRILGLYRSLGYAYKVALALAFISTTRTKLDHLPELKTIAPSERMSLLSLFNCPHLPQGAPTSPAIANLVAYRLDARLHGLAQKAGFTYTRYADDLLFSGSYRLKRLASSFAIQVAAIALDEGFAIQHRKTRVMPQSVKQRVAGLVVNAHPNVDRSTFDTLKAILTNCIRHGPSTQNRDNHPDFRSHLLGRVGWVHQVHPARGERLRRLVAQIDWEK